MKTVKWFIMMSLALSTAMVLAACSGGGSGGGGNPSSKVALSPLVVAEQVSVVDAQSSGGSGIQALLINTLLSDIPAISDYRNDKTSVYVNERSVDSFRTVNEILCMVAQSRYDAMLNKGAYKAQIDLNLCSSSRSDASSAGQQSTNQSSGSNAPNYENWTIESSRASKTSPHIVKVWIHEPASEHDAAKTIEAHLVITEGASESNAYGLFTINFKAYSPGNPGTLLFKGFLRTEVDNGQVLLKFASKDAGAAPGDPPRSVQKAVLQKANDTGTGTVYELSNWDPGHLNQEMQYDVAFNTENFLRSDGTTDVCLDRKAFDESAWRYGLYDSTTGARINRNSGFSIKKGNNYGWVGYWGLWLPQGVTVTNGDTVYKHNYSDNTDLPFTVVKAGGKLKKHTRKSLMLGEIKNIPLDMYDNMTNMNYRVVYNSGTFTRIAKTNQSMNWMWQDIPGGDPERNFNMSSLNWTELNFWSQALSGQVRVKLSGCSGTGPFNCTGTASDSSPVVFYAEDIVYPGDVIPGTLACFDNCPLVSALSTTSPFKQGINGYQNVAPALASYASYSFDSVNMVLKDGAIDVVASATDPMFQWGIMSGALFEPTTANLDNLACTWNTSNTCGWQAWSELTVFYTWETGPNDWNRFTALSDNGAIIKFQPPLHVQYIHVQADNTKPDYKYNGAKFYLEYSGFGELQGIPGKCVNMDTGETVSCDQNTRWVPELSIPDMQDASLTGVTADGISYLVKALEKEQRMTGVDVTTCTGAGLSTTSYDPLPDVDDAQNGWVDPAIGAEPAVGAPAVIGGVVQ